MEAAIAFVMETVLQCIINNILFLILILLIINNNNNINNLNIKFVI